MPTSQFAQTYNSFSGVDIIPSFNGIPIGEMQGISFTVTREKAPLYTMGQADPRSYSRGKRGIAGALVFLVFDRSALFDTLSKNQGDNQSYFWANTWEIPEVVNQVGPPLVTEIQDAIGELSPTAQLNTADYKISQKAWYHDQIPPFDIFLLAINEYGHSAQMEVKGVEILNMGSGTSVDDITIDESCTYVARQIVPWISRGHVSASDEPGRSYAFRNTDGSSG